MLPEMQYIEEELLPMLREQADQQERSAQKQLRQWRREPGVCSLLLHINNTPAAERLPEYDHKEVYYDSEKMFVSELKSALGTALAKGDGVPSVRSNMGCGIFTTLLGIEQQVFADKMPWVKQHISKETLKNMTPDRLTESADYRLALDHMRYMKKKLAGTGIALYPMDLQGSVDTAHIVLGDDFFYELYDDEGFVKHLFELSNACILKGAQDCLEIIQPTEYVAHYNSLVMPVEHPFKISEDTSTLLGRDHIMEYAVIYTNRLLKDLGGGYIHYCGKNDHLLDAAITCMPDSLGLNFGDYAKHDMPNVLRRLVRAGKLYYGVMEIDEMEAFVKAAYENGVYHIMPWIRCDASEEDAACEAFARAVEHARRV